ncbi:MAG: hypothetical protein HY282_11890 [Nitrospirae bacterium]|nr:hypothetical protein [Candidatus Manganitrophaceae bacterium]
MQFDWKKMIWIGILLAAPLFLGGANGEGCGGKSVLENLGDDSTKEAKVEKARIALDDRDFATAIETLQELCGTSLTAPTCDPEIVSLYASAYAGRAGLDVFDLIKEGANQPAASGATSYTLFSKHFSSPTAANVSDIGAAVSLLTSIPSRTPDQGLQLAIASTSDLVIFLGSLTGGYNTTTGKPNALPAVSSVNAAALSRVLADVGDMDTGLTEANIGNDNISGHIQQIQQSLSGGSATTVVTFLGGI